MKQANTTTAYLVESVTCKELHITNKGYIQACIARIGFLTVDSRDFLYHCNEVSSIHLETSQPTLLAPNLPTILGGETCLEGSRPAAWPVSGCGASKLYFTLGGHGEIGRDVTF